MSGQGRVFLVDDDDLILSMLARSLKKVGYEVRTDPGEADVVGSVRAFRPDVIMLDINLPDKSGIEILEELVERNIDAQVVMLTSDDSAETAIKAMKLGAVDYLTKPFNLEEVRIVVAKLMASDRLNREVEVLRRVNAELLGGEFIGESRATQEIRDQAEKIAEAGVSTVLITGESGTGKEVVATYVHRLLHEGRLEGIPFVPVNCTALPETLLQSELFGHEKGAFTDAKTDKKGVFELANGGTILLDEIGDMKADFQSQLLRVLEERMVRRIGAKQESPVNVTVLATTNRNLAEAMETGSFRNDLYYRLSAFSLHILPLRERRDDILPLANHFLAHFARRYNKQPVKTLSSEAEAVLGAYDWPGNVRELKNVIERVVVLEKSEILRGEHLPAAMRPAATAELTAAGRCILPAEGISLDAVHKDLIVQALERTGHNKTLAAKLLSLSYDVLRYQVKKLGLE